MGEGVPEPNRGFRRRWPLPAIRLAVIAFVLTLVAGPTIWVAAIPALAAPIANLDNNGQFDLRPGQPPIGFHYDNHTVELAGLPEPAQLKTAAGSEYAFQTYNNAASDTLEGIMFRRVRYLKDFQQRKPNGTPMPWGPWLRSYIILEGNRNKGAVYENDVGPNRLGLTAANGWETRKVIEGAPVKNPLDRVRITRDASGKITKLEIVEFKSGDKIPAKQLSEHLALINWAKAKGIDVDYHAVFGKKPTDTNLRYYRSQGLNPRGLPATGTPLARDQSAIPVDAKGTPLPVSTSTAKGKALQSEVQTPTTGPVAADSDAPATAEQAEVKADAIRNLADQLGIDPEEYTGDDLGGVDFSTLELRYVSDTDSADGPGADFAFQAKATADGQLSYGGAATVKQASDSFFVWLALPPEKFTVNLNPTEPDRIVDADLGRTDAGKALLEADLQLKKTTAKLIHPDSALGAQYWSELAGMDDPNSCNSFRTWIVPAPAKVWEDQGQLYILDAPLDVKMETDYIQDEGSMPAGIQPCERHDPAVDRHNEDVFKTLILPKIVDAVNHAPEYQDLRRVYYSRVAAQWIRDRSKQKTTAYSRVIDSGNIDQWALNTGWRPEDVFDAYVKSYRDHEFSVTRTTSSGDTEVTRTYVFGGVDFTASPQTDVGNAAFERDFAALPSTVANARSEVTGDASGDSVWLGGTAAPDPQANGVAAARAKSQTVGWVVVGVGSVVFVAVIGFLLFLFGPRKRHAPRPVPLLALPSSRGYFRAARSARPQRRSQSSPQAPPAGREPPPPGQPPAPTWQTPSARRATWQRPE